MHDQRGENIYIYTHRYIYIQQVMQYSIVSLYITLGHFDIEKLNTTMSISPAFITVGWKIK